MAFDHGTLHVTTKPGCAVVAETFTVEGDRLVGTDVGVVVDHAVPVGETGCAANPITDWVIGMLQADPVITQVAAQRIEVSNQADRVTLHQNS
jgi:hypothetical protein